MCTLIFFQRFIALQNGKDLISKVHATLCLKHIRTKKDGVAQQKPPKITRNT